MTDLGGRVILVVEDEYLIAEEAAWMLQQAGAEVLGPVGTLSGALALLKTVDRLDGAVLDINLHHETVYPLAEALDARGVPYVFLTGYDMTMLPERYQHVLQCGKPIEQAHLVGIIARQISFRSSS